MAASDSWLAALATVAEAAEGTVASMQQGKTDRKALGIDAMLGIEGAGKKFLLGMAALGVVVLVAVLVTRRRR